MNIDLSVVVPALNEEQNVAQLIPRTWAVLERIGCVAEIIVVVGPSTDQTAAISRHCGARVIEQKTRGYGGALAEGFAASQGEYVLTMDADLSHAPVFIATLWAARESAEVLIASRYVRGGRAIMPRWRLIMSRILNMLFPFVLSLPLKDMSSGFRLYRRTVLQGIDIHGTNFDALQELLLHAYADGWRVRELPFAYQPRGAGRSKASLIRFAKSYLRTLTRMWMIRNDLACADYEERTFDSRIPLQRWWQRQRYDTILSMAQNYIGQHILDVGCGSNRLLLDLPGAVGIDIRHHKLRYMRRYGMSTLVCGDLFSLPFRDAQFDCVICSRLLERVPGDPSPLSQLLRILRDDGILILATPDYSTRAWRFFERLYEVILPRDYPEHHITRYSKESLISALEKRGWICTSMRFVFGGEMIGMFQRAAASPTSGIHAAPVLIGEAKNLGVNAQIRGPQ